MPLGPIARARPNYRYRPALGLDLETLVRHRVAMWREIRDFPSAMLREHGAVYRRWLRPRLRSGEIAGVVVEAPDGTVAASGCLWFQPAQPRPGIDRLTSPYVLSMFTEPAHRGRSIASSIVKRLAAISRRRNYSRVFLHASPMGEPVYARLGFERTTEMHLWLDRKLKAVYRRASAATAGKLGRRREVSASPHR